MNKGKDLDYFFKSLGQYASQHAVLDDKSLILFVYEDNRDQWNSHVDNLIAHENRGPDLRGLNLGDFLDDGHSGIGLEQFNFSRANLAGTNLTCAMWQGANLNRADLTGAVLIEADLRGTDMRGANLTGAILTGSSLEDADLEGANFKGVKLDGVIINSGQVVDLIIERLDKDGGLTSENAADLANWVKYANTELLDRLTKGTLYETVERTLNEGNTQFNPKDLYAIFIPMSCKPLTYDPEYTITDDDVRIAVSNAPDLSRV